MLWKHPPLVLLKHYVRSNLRKLALKCQDIETRHFGLLSLFLFFFKSQEGILHLQIYYVLYICRLLQLMGLLGFMFLFITHQNWLQECAKHLAQLRCGLELYFMG